MTKTEYYSQRRSDSILYPIWSRIRWNTQEPKASQWPSIGGAGIKMNQDWIKPKEGFDAFRDDILTHLGERPSGDHMLCRINTQGHFYINNLCWETRKQAGQHRKTNHYVKYQGRKMSLSELATLTGIEYSCLFSRIVDYGLKPKEAVNAQIYQRHHKPNNRKAQQYQAKKARDGKINLALQPGRTT